MEQDIMLRETLLDPINDTKAQQIKRVLFGGYHRKQVEDSIQHLTTTYEDLLVEVQQQLQIKSNQYQFLNEEFTLVKEQRQELQELVQQQAQEISQLEGAVRKFEQRIQKQEFQIRLQQRKQDQEHERLAAMREQLGEALLQISVERKAILEKAKVKRDEIIDQARIEANAIVEQQAKAFNQMAEGKYKELKELEEVQKDGLELMCTFSEEVTQLGFKVEHMKRQLSKELHIPSLIHFDKKEEPDRFLKIVK